MSCPYHVHASSNLIIEVHAKKAINYSYDAINIIGRLELVPKEDLYNIFFRLKEAKVASVKTTFLTYAMISIFHFIDLNFDFAKIFDRGWKLTNV